MTCGDLIEYLSEFDPKETVAIMLVDIKNRIYHKIGRCKFIDEKATLLLETTGSGSLDDIAEEEQQNG